MTCKRSDTDQFDAGFQAALDQINYEIDRRLKGPDRCHEECEYRWALVEVSNFIHDLEFPDES